MHDPVITDPASNHEQHRMPLRGRVFRWGIWFWILAWCFSILVHLQFVVNLKGCWGMRFFMGAGSVGVKFHSYGTAASNHIRLGEPFFLWSESYLDHLRQNPGDFVGMLASVGWSGHGFSHTLAFPVVGLLWLWLIGGWMDLKKFRWAEFRRSGRMIGRAAILVALPLVILMGDYKARRISEAASCTLNVRNIQQALRGYSGMHSLMTGALIPWSEIIGHGKILEPYSGECPCGQNYRLKSQVPDVGVLAAECPSPEHQRRLKAKNTSEW